MLQTVPTWRLPSRVFGGDIYDNFVKKLKQSFAQPTQMFVFHGHFVDFLMIFTQIKAT